MKKKKARTSSARQQNISSSCSNYAMAFASLSLVIRHHPHRALAFHARRLPARPARAVAPLTLPKGTPFQISHNVNAVRPTRICFSTLQAAVADDNPHDDDSNDDSSPSNNKFQITAPYPPCADQPKAIDRLVHQIQRGDKHGILRGCTGTGKTMVMAHTIARLGKPTLVLCHNKTLAAQLARELRSCLSQNHVHLFVSYYNHYVPESFSEVANRYTSKKSSINDELDALRHLATRALVQHSDVVVVSSVSCIYGLGMPKSYLDASLHWSVGEEFDSVGDIVGALESNLYARPGDEDDEEPSVLSNTDLSRGEYHLVHNGVGGSASVTIWPPSESFPMRIDFEPVATSSPPSTNTNKLGYRISSIAHGHSSGMTSVSETTIFPAKHHITESSDRFDEALRRIQDELADRVAELRSDNKHVEADRLSQRVGQDLLLLKETGTCPGVENYSRHMALREEGVPPDTLLDYFGFRADDNWLLLVDESHVTLPQLKAMYGGDRARKKSLVKHGYRLPSALDNRPLKADEFWERVPQSVFVSATPSPRELSLLVDIRDNDPVDMVIRPTYVCDPEIHVRPTNEQLEDLVKEVKGRALRQERTLAMALTKRDAEDLADYLIEQGVNSTYIHSGLNTHERSNALKALQNGEIDCLVGVNLLREGLDLPQVSLVAILNADSEGFLRSETALLQTIGRAARNVKGTAILYANRITGSMQQCISATKHRRDVQLAYNEKHKKEMRSTKGSSVLSIFDLLKDQIASEQPLDVVKTTDSGKKKVVSPVRGEAPSGKSISMSSNQTIETDHIPSKPGVYFWKDVDGQPLYIGKAKRLRSRVKSYLSPGAKHSKRIQVMLKKSQSVEFILTPSDRDALILESNLIKHHQPAYNVLLKDDESYPYICATIGDAFPQFTIVPRRQGGEKASRYKYFGPYPHFSEINTILERIEEVYDLRSKSFQARFGTVSKAEYHKHFQKVMSEVFEAEGTTFSKSSLSALRSEYEEASKLFESAYNQCRDVVALGKSHDGSTFVVHVLQLRQGLIAGQFSYSVELSSGLDSEEDFSDAIQTVLEQRHYPSGEAAAGGDFSFFPDEVLCQYPIIEAKELRAVLRSARNQAEPDRKGSKIDIRTLVNRGPRKDVDSRALECAIANAEQVANEKAMTKIPGIPKSSVDGTAAQELVSLLSLEKVPERIECYDISHTQGEGAVGSRVVFIDGRPVPSLYRKFNIKTVDGVDDYASLEEVLERRFRRAWKSSDGALVDKTDAWAMPDLVVIDGGKGQLSAALKGMQKAGVFPAFVSSVEATDASLDGLGDTIVIHEETYPPLHVVPTERQTTVNVVALAKNKEEVFVSSHSDPINDSPDSPALLLLRALRDESHRFALTSHRRRRSRVNGL